MFHRQCSEVSVEDEVTVNAVVQEIRPTDQRPALWVRYPGGLRFKPGARLLPSIVDRFRMFEHACIGDQTQERGHAGS